MFNDLEIEFKKGSVFRKTTNRLLLFFVIYLLGSSFLLSKIRAPFWMTFIVAIVMYFIVYCVVIVANFKNKLYKGEKWYIIFNVLFNLDIFKKQQRNLDKSILIELSKKYQINTRHKVSNIIDHYRNLVPRISVGGSNFLSVLAIVITSSVFIYDNNAKIVNEKTSFICGMVMLFSILWWTISSLVNQIGNIYNKKSFYLRMEEMYTEIYICRDIR